MKQFLYLLLSFSCIWILGCSEDSTTAPEEDGNYYLETTETIGTTGGTIEIDDFSLTIPSGAFTSDQTIEVYASSDDQPFDQTQVTRSFRLIGLPDEISTPLRLSIKYDGVLSDESYIAYGALHYDYLVGDTTMVFNLWDASDSSGTLICELPLSFGISSQNPSGIASPLKNMDEIPEALVLIGITGHKTHRTPHFNIKYPIHLTSVNINDVGNLLEYDYSVIVDSLHLSFEETDWHFSRIPVVIEQLYDKHGGYSGFAAYIWQRNDESTIQLNQKKLVEGHLNSVRIQAGQLLLAGVTRSYDDAALSHAHLWFHMAITRWAECKFTDDAGYAYPELFHGKELAPFDGIRAGATEDADTEFDHGIGMSAVIEYLVNDPRFGEQGLRDALERIWGGSSATYALLNTVNAFVTEWWPDFFKSYVGGEIYGVGKDVFLAGANLSGTWTIDDGNDTDSTFTLNYPDLSAKLFKINLEYGSIDPAASLALDLSSEVSTPISVMLFGVEGNELKYWGHSTALGSTSLLVPDVKDLYDDGWRELLVVVVNCDVSDTYLEETEITLEMKVLSGPSNLEYTGCAMDLTNMHIYLLLDYQDPGEEDVEIEVNRGFDSDYRTGSMTGNTFRANWEYEEQGTTYEGAIEATFIGNPPTTITSLDFTQTKRTDQETRIDSLVMSNVPITETWDGGCRIELQASAVCDYVDQLVITRGYTIYQEVMQGWECNDDSFRTHILIGFSEN